MAAGAMRLRLEGKREALAALRDRSGTPPLPPNFGQRRAIRLVTTDEGRVERQRRFRLLLLRRAYPLSHWLPPEAVLHLARVDLDPEGTRLLLTLTSGTKLLDTGDRILVQGHADDITVAEMAACVERRGWMMVEVSGDPAFRIEMSRELLSRGIEVADCPLPAEEAAALRREAGGFDWRLVDGTGDQDWVPPVPRPPWADQLS